MLSDMPILAEFKGVPIHDYQDEARIRTVVMPEIERAMSLDSTEALFAFLKDPYRSPEARLEAGRRLLNPAEELEAQRRKVSVDVARVKAHMAGLGSLRHASPVFYGTWLAPGLRPGSPPLPARPPEHAEALREAQAACR
jgi:hypothetical protein